MHLIQPKTIFWLTLLIALLPSCTTQAWYEGVRQGTENECRNQPQSEQARCLENLNKKTYDDYEKERASKK